MLHPAKVLEARKTSIKPEANNEMNRSFSMIIFKILLLTVSVCALQLARTFAYLRSPLQQRR